MSSSLIRNLKFRTIFKSIFGFATFLIIGIAYFGITNFQEKNQTLNYSLVANEMTDNLIKATGTLAVERGVTSSALATKDQKLQEKINSLRKQSDESWKHAFENIEKLQATGKTIKSFEAAITALKAKEAAFVSARKSVDSSLSQGGGDTIDAKEFIRVITELIEATQDVRITAFSSSSALQDLIFSNIVLKQNVWEMSEFAGRERANIAPFIGKGEGFPIDVQKQLFHFRKIVEKAGKNVKSFGENSNDAALKSAISTMESKFFQEYETLRKDVYRESEAGGKNYAVSSVDWIAQASTAIDSIIAISDATRAYNDGIIRGLEESKIRDLTMNIVIFLVVVSTSFVIFLAISKKVAAIELLRRSIVEISQGEGDLTKRLPEDSRDEFGEIAKAFNSFISHLQSLINLIKEAGNELNATATEITRASADISEATLRQSDDTSSVSAAMEETTSSIISVNDSIAAVKQQSDNTMVILVDGSAAQQTAAHHIEEFRTKSKLIEAITETIQGIAFQTNILALNAAVEAARAGDEGRGFAVVATEVRSLAQKTAESAREIGKIIEGIISIVKSVDEASGQVTGILAKVSVNVRETTQNVNSITEAIAEQKTASQSISVSIEAIAAMTDQTSCTIQQSEKDSKQLQAISNQLISLVRKFRT